MKKIAEQTCREFTDLLASKSPVPGGGGSAALCGAIGAALGNMVGSLTVGKKNYAAVEEEMLAMKQRSNLLQEQFLKLADEDAEGFAPLSAAYRLPADTQEEKQYKQEMIERCSKDACQVPLQIMECCCEAIDLTETYARLGSRLAVSDAGCAAALLYGALEAASLNIYINTRNLSDRAFAETANSRADGMLEAFGQKAEELFQGIRRQLH